MTGNAPRNIAASIRQRLLNLAKQHGEEFQGLLIRFGIARLLYRLAASPHRDRFVVKGATLFAAWTGQPYRPTKDLDLLGYGDPSIASLEAAIRAVCEVPSEEDGLIFDVASVHGEPIREDEDYPGTRVTLIATLDGARIPLQIDIAFGEAVVPGPTEVEFGAFLDLPTARLRAYPKEVVVAEKFETTVSRGIANSRMRDFYDVWVLASDFEFDGRVLAEAFQSTFQNRGTALPETVPLALTEEFAADVGKQAQWSAFVGKGRFRKPPGTLTEIMPLIRDFVIPPATALRRGDPFEATWPPGGTWQQKSSTRVALFPIR